MNWKEHLAAFARSKLPKKAFRLCVYDNALVPPALLNTIQNREGSILIVIPDAAQLEYAASSLDDLCGIIGETRPIVPLPEVSPSRRMWIPENEAGRCAALEMALSGTPAIYLTTASVLLSSTLAPKSFKSSSFTLKKGDSIAPAKLAEKLVELDYDNEIEVQTPGEFSRRGGIFDVYSPLYEAPVRIEFWGDEIDSLRFFQPDTQRSFEEAEELRIVPRGTAVLEADGQATAKIRDFFPKNIQAILVNQPSISEHIATYLDAEALSSWEKTEKGFQSPIQIVTRPDDIFDDSDNLPNVRLPAISMEQEFASSIPDLGDGAVLWHLQQLKDSFKRWSETKQTVVACLSEQGEIDRFRQMLSDDKELAKYAPIIEHQHIAQGLMLPDEKLILLSSQEIFGRRAKIRRKRVKNYRHDNSLGREIEIEEGAYVVHVAHGIALFRGIRKVETMGEVQEVLVLEFDEGVLLYVPLEEAFMVSRYMGAGKAQPKLNKLGTTSWDRTKKNAMEAAYDLAAELIRTEAMRQQSTGHAMKPSIEWERSFANSFPYKTTVDQEAAINQVLADMADDKPMDRLLCGDVGFGKTEVAVRAAFRAVLNGKQVAVLAPTTVLAQQHYQTFRERMAEYPVAIDVISRFRTASEQNKILEKTAAGEIDILIGTHRIIQNDVHFRNLGLLVIDEEQRFGVKHKQRLKSLRSDLDILTMTATPIPRTLYFSLSGIRNLSTIMTPPVDRLPVTTIVANFDEKLIKLAITRELERKGQVFFLFNRVKNIDNMQEFIQRLVPEARCQVAHGQMPPSQLEKIMDDFVKHKSDVLVCTTIIESGIDIPNVNTIIIDRADRFGLSELYQLRGRVGRHHRQAYAYLLLPTMGGLAENARERLSAIRRYTHLGAGFKLAMRDLEIRGAGNILGTEQSGHIAAVGFELYCQLLKDAVNGLSKNMPKKKPLVQVNLDKVTFALSVQNGKTPIGFPPDFINDLNSRIECYKRLEEIDTNKKLQDFKQELEDRFGKLPQETANLLIYHSLRIAATQQRLVSISAHNGKFFIETQHGLFRQKNGELPPDNSTNGHEQILKALSAISGFNCA